MENALRKTLSGDGNSQFACWSRFKSLLGLPEVLQPTILAISLTYIVYTVSAELGLNLFMPAAVQFTYYCCILGCSSCILFYVKLLYSENGHWTCNIIYLCILTLLVILYIYHWLVAPDGKYQSAVREGQREWGREFAI